MQKVTKSQISANSAARSKVTNALIDMICLLLCIRSYYITMGTSGDWKVASVLTCGKLNWLADGGFRLGGHCL